ncbi:glycosyltransferase family 57 protein [Fomitiporia mediterranea MF3/22]|uniref:glycosyltransferase family 57 protein n=1 Tax=Fomitiporia mediterranea (strain MF3/22) TaxID=694068 RepID=UPI0004407352|nr:glycosyltransferase family 57 protein [Fomitiporia mediterranea MF3/22]EJD01446.1 glycosyltransferase family 57 protein [Fomitiporia mediterranea MF3/22]
MASAGIAFPTSSPQTTTFPDHPTLGRRTSVARQDSTSNSTSDQVTRRPDPWWKDISPSERDLFVLSTVLKVLLFPSYRSTDFEVHRNWLAITHSLPISKWYYDTTSEWTLDYPPFFAYFEYLLSIPASLVDRRIVDLNNLNYDSWSVIAFQRTSVIVTEIVLGLALLRFIRGAVEPSTQRIISASLFLHPGFLIVDHIHFQYNGFMFGILLWSILSARNGNLLGCGFFFAVLLNFKHIYMYQAPAYFVYLLRAFCMSPQGKLRFGSFLSLANIVIAVFVVSIGPFLLMGQLPQLASRLFPFKRGLNHAYWAPNAWALVTALDRVLLQYVRRFGAKFALNVEGVSSASRGLVGDTVFAILPNVKPLHCFIITLAFQSIFMVKLWMTPTYKSFLCALTLCGYVSYMFGWHVHEKAILLVLVPLSLLAAENHAFFRTFMLASVAGIYSLFPLLFTPAETLVKVLYSIIWMYLIFRPLQRRVYEFPRSLPMVIVDHLERLYLVGFTLLQVFVTVFPLLTGEAKQKVEDMKTAVDGAQSDSQAVNYSTKSEGSMEFLPLMLTSIYCAVGLTWAFLRLSYIYLKSPPR